MIKLGQIITTYTGEKMGAPDPKEFNDLCLDIYRTIHTKRGFRLTILNTFMPDNVKQMCVVENHFNGMDGIAHVISTWQNCPCDEIFLQPRLDLFYDKDHSED